ncbi:hypothetical protein A5683_05215 [Mycobacterium mantenii]|uniref:Uncharacterized protein n=2 Tax=Mycobacterium mantenii TaxID=560555 RepID=A0A1A2SZ33_MYCNT|nr:hypothetical protein A5688_17375 [Mycobacterium mantenii]OBH69400.1 hypothetical protein A5683_05215 [Mycobacterium mantenii]
MSDVSATTDADEVVVSRQDESLLLGGDPAAVESYLIRLRAVAGHAIRVAGIDSASLANAAIAGLAALLADSGTYVKLQRDSLDALKDGNLVPVADGFFRLTTGADAGQLLAQLHWRPELLGPEVMLSAQMIAVQMALKSAVAEVEDAVRRVEDKVESVLEVARAQRAGDVLGTSLTISRMVDSLDKYGSLPEAYWDSVAALGPALNVTVEQLRNHVQRILASFDHTQAVQQRAGKLRNAISENRLGDTLSLLVIAEEALHQWQRLNLARIESTQPEHLLRAIDEARELVDHHLREDLEIYRSAKEVLDRFGKTEAIDGFRFWAVRELAKQRGALRDELDHFAKARQHQVETWEDFHIPSVLDAALATVEAVGSITGQVLVAVGRGLVFLGGQVAGPFRGGHDDDGSQASSSGLEEQQSAC